MGFLIIFLLGVVAGGFVGYFVAVSFLPAVLLEAEALYVEVPVIGEAHALILFATVMGVVIGGGLAGRSTV